MPDALCTLVLAAGQGSRYRERSDEDKLLAGHTPALDAMPILAMTLGALAGIGDRMLVVTREDNHPLRAWLEREAPAYGAQVLAIRSNGLGHSLGQAVSSCATRRGWLVALADMPYVRRDTLERLAAAIQPQRLVVPVHQGQRGHPRGIGADFGALLRVLSGERGAQALFDSPSVIEIEVDDPGVLQDVDRPEDRRPG
ncbi:nucleotidyltransferase family protein [Stutzerimonas marianensis]